MSTSQENLVSPPDYTDPSGYDFDPMRFADDLAAYGIEAGFMGEQGMNVLDALGPEDDFWRLQVMQEFYYAVDPDDNLYAPVQFRVTVNTVGQPTSTLERHFRTVARERLLTLFNTGTDEARHWRDRTTTYAGYLDGWQFGEVDPVSVERHAISAQEADNLGVCQWFAEVYDEDGAVRGEASGFFDPWTVTEPGYEVPQYEEWKVSRRDDRGTYEIQPTAGARRRLKNLSASKGVIVNGRPVGGVNRSRGYIEINQRYSDHVSNDGGETKYDGDHSRYGLVQAGMHPNEMQDHGTVYKVRETPETIVLVTSRARVQQFEEASGQRWEPLSDEEVDPSKTGEPFLALVEEESTLFDIRKDLDTQHGGSALGRYAAPTAREVTERTAATDIVVQQ